MTELTVLYDPGRADGVPNLDLILVHGIDAKAGPVETWTHRPSGVFWPRDLLPGALPSTRVLSFGYHYKSELPEHPGRTLNRLARHLLSDILHFQDQETNKGLGRPIAFLAHSFGGLIVKNALLCAESGVQFQRVLDATSTLLFFGTPHRLPPTNQRVSPSIVRQWKDEQVLFQTVSKILSDIPKLDRGFQVLAPRFKIASFYEVEDAMVDNFSACMTVPDEKRISVNANHAALCKFRDEDDETFMAVCRSLALAGSGDRREIAPPATRDETSSERPYVVLNNGDARHAAIMYTDAFRGEGGPPEMRLCEYCSAIPFDSIANRSTLPGGSRRWGPLGDIKRVQSSSCPFCQLVSYAICKYQASNVNSLQDREALQGDISVEWAKSLAPGCRPGFRITKQFDAWIAFGDVRSSHDAKAASLRYLRPRVAPRLNVERVSSWIKHCTVKHGCIAHLDDYSITFPRIHVLRFIDVERACVVGMKAGRSPYAALSYVWGGVTSSRLLRSNQATLMEPGALDRNHITLPTTISDAMNLVSRLGIRYLWVDSLCLVQDNSVDVREGLKAMGRIYEHASLTIVAASGDNANAGLPGVRSGSRKRQDILREVQPGIHLGMFLSPDHLLKRSVYETRAWTMQEHLFSRRILYFIDDTVFFRCREAEHLESCHDDDNPKKALSNMSTRIMEAMEMESPLEDFGDILMYYSRRSLTMESDALSAMEGISQQFASKLGYEISVGLPVGAWDHFILFSGRNLRRRPGFPSYSWAGWKGSLCPFPSPDDSIPNWLDTHTWIVWYIADGDRSYSLVWDPFEWARKNSMRPLKRDAFHQGYRERVGFCCPGLEFEHGARPILPTQSTPFVSLPHCSGFLRFWTVSIFMQVKDTGLHYGKAALFGVDGKQYGAIELDGLDECNVEASVLSGPSELILLSGVSGDRPYEGVALPKPAGDHAEYHVMLLEWDEEIAERRGIGKLRREGLAKSYNHGPAWKEITLA